MKSKKPSRQERLKVQKQKSLNQFFDRYAPRPTNMKGVWVFKRFTEDLQKLLALHGAEAIEGFNLEISKTLAKLQVGG